MELNLVSSGAVAAGPSKTQQRGRHGRVVKKKRQKATHKARDPEQSQQQQKQQQHQHQQRKKKGVPSQQRQQQRQVQEEEEEESLQQGEPSAHKRGSSQPQNQQQQTVPLPEAGKRVDRGPLKAVAKQRAAAGPVKIGAPGVKQWWDEDDDDEEDDAGAPGDGAGEQETHQGEEAEVDLKAEKSKALDILGGLLKERTLPAPRPAKPKQNQSYKPMGKSRNETQKQSPQQDAPRQDHVSSGADDSSEDDDNSGDNQQQQQQQQHRQQSPAQTPPQPPQARSRKNQNPSMAAPSEEHLKTHYARPRELSRHSSATPLPTRRSEHVFSRDVTFLELGLIERMASYLAAPKAEGRGLALCSPTVCQSAALPVLCEGHNAVVKSETGSGKTLAYLLPVINDLASMTPQVSRKDGAYAVVLAPTRELALQIFEVLERLLRPFIWLVPGLITGGEKKKAEKSRIRKGINIVVSTPGRLRDHLQTTKRFETDRLRWAVFDEADRLLDLGFEKQVEEILELLGGIVAWRRDKQFEGAGQASSSGGEGGSNRKRSMVLCSATLSPGLSKFATKVLGHHVLVDSDRQILFRVDGKGIPSRMATAAVVSEKEGDGAVGGGDAGGGGGGDGDEGENDTEMGSTNRSYQTPQQLVQQYMMVTQKLRLAALCAFLRKHAHSKVVVFFSTCDAVDFHHLLFSSAKWPDKAVSDDQQGGGGVNGYGDGYGEDEEEEEEGGSSDGEGEGVKAKKLSRRSSVSKRSLFGADVMVCRLHGNVAQADRLVAYRSFEACDSGVLLCTDVAARGLDLPTVGWIVQYDPPVETSDYVHRVGRTARKGEKGSSLLFLTPAEKDYLPLLQKHGLKPRPLGLEAVLRACAQPWHEGRRADEQVAYELQLSLQRVVEKDRYLLEASRMAFQSHVRAYATHAADCKHIFQVRSLHIGHVARSFGLKDAPTSIKARPQGGRKRKERHDRNDRSGGGKKIKGAGKSARMVASEFSM